MLSLLALILATLRFQLSAPYDKNLSMSDPSRQSRLDTSMFHPNRARGKRVEGTWGVKERVQMSKSKLTDSLAV